ncbi:NADP-dependent oxidoreductase domain-containing protein [Dichotomopilus funicola]|uniref:NADP-dependent oxidoreductase domain-containing protein n=1 Tax=Dichotomopilus funicola TaxID=1934379 RepID=A0AAN6V7U7_9PEZI|nr:NADP-dependent oxidoreductase domain-containing protein [Dichotomopilus funicola]
MPPNTPLLLYGTAWKEDTTAKLTETALENGFTGVDTANYPTAYNEPLTGDGIAAALGAGLKRSDLFIQTKFTPVWAHEKDKIPFNPDQSIEDQVKESIKQSLEHLKVDYLDALFLHIYFENDADNLIAWKVFETFVPHTIRRLGVSNFNLSQLRELYDAATVKPSFVQNRFYKETGFDLDVRGFCAEHGITYQAYWMLRHNPEVLESEILASVDDKLHVKKELAFYVLILGLGGTQVLDGTTKPERMLRDVKTVAEVFSNEALLGELQRDIDEFRKLLEKLAG